MNMKNNDPAFLFYSSDFLNGVADLTMEERGQYITMMCLQHQKGAISEKTIRLCLGSVSVDVLSKFIQDENGCYYNERLREEINKRTQYIESRRINGKNGGRPKKPYAKPYAEAYENHSENEDENIIVNKRNNIDYIGIINYWNENCKSYASVSKLTEKRKNAIRKLIANCNTDIDEIKKAMLLLENADPFWKGENDKHWVASFDWFIADTKGCFARILEGAMNKDSNGIFNTNKNGDWQS